MKGSSEPSLLAPGPSSTHKALRTLLFSTRSDNGRGAGPMGPISQMREQVRGNQGAPMASR